MSRHTYYQAIHEGSSLFRRTQADGAFHALFAQLTLLGPGPFRYADLDTSEIMDTLDWLTQESIFASRAQAEATLGELRGEIERALASDPGIGQRSAYLEQVHDEWEEHLSAVLCLRSDCAGRALIDPLLYGAVDLAPEPAVDGLPWFRLVPASFVAEGAALLENLESLDLYPDTEKWDLYPVEDYERWRRLYLECSKLGRAVIVLAA